MVLLLTLTWLASMGRSANGSNLEKFIFAIKKLPVDSSIVRLGFCKDEILFDALENLLVAQAFQPVPEQPGAAVPHFL